MLLHNLHIAWKSMKRNRTLSALIVTGIALGIALSTTFATARHAFARDPIPAKSSVLHYVRMDSWDPLHAYPGEDPKSLPSQITYRDMVEIMRSKIPARQSAMFKTSLYVFPEPKVSRPFKETIRLCFADFFPMFQTPFKYGSGWDAKGDAGPESVIVISATMNDKLFGGANSVGRTIRIENQDFRVAGVLDRWQPSVKFYDPTQNALQAPEEIYMPFHQLKPMKLQTFGNSDGWGPSPAQPGLEGRLVSETCWIQMWVELPDAASVAAYRSFLDSYALDQKRHGRFLRPVNNRVSTVREVMKDFRIVPKETNTLLIVSLLFLLVCSVNLVGLLLGKFLARANEVGIRRALGASRLDIFLQHVVECELIGLVGGFFGLILSLGILAILNGTLKTMSGRPDFFRLDPPMVALSIGLSLLAGLAAGLYPAWRTCQLPPAVHLSIQ
jgi:putative ABC transport system permease protein